MEQLYSSNKQIYNLLRCQILNQHAGSRKTKNNAKRNPKRNLKTYKENKNKNVISELTDKNRKKIYQELILGVEQIYIGHLDEMEIIEIKSQVLSVQCFLSPIRTKVWYVI